MNVNAPAAQSLECPVCLEQFNGGTKQPKVLGACGHSLCEPCLNGCIRRDIATCPECQLFSVRPERGFPTNYGLMSKSRVSLSVLGFRYALSCSDLISSLNEARATHIKCTECQQSAPSGNTFLCKTCTHQGPAQVRHC